MTTRIDEITDGVYRISTFSPVGPPGGITFNQFLLLDEEPALIHTGMPGHFADTLAAATTVMDPRRLRWITSNHASRPDELGALDQWFGTAPHARVVHGYIACFVHLSEVAPERIRSVADGETVELGARRLRWMATPHVPGPWEAGFWFDEKDRILFTGDVFAQTGQATPTTTDDIVGPAVTHDEGGRATALTAATATTVRTLAQLEPSTLALMHGPTFRGDGATALRSLADHFEDRFRREADATLSTLASQPSRC